MQKIRVILTDDHPVVRSGIRNLLEQAGDIVVVGEAGDGAHALHLISDLAPDVILLDMEMPGMNGIDVARQLHSDGVEVKILALSAYDDEQYIEGLLAAGASGYLTKDEAESTIVQAVRGVAQGQEGWMSRRATEKFVRTHRQGGEGNPLDELSAREMDVLRLLANGLSNGQIALKLNIAERTVRFHLHNIYDKLRLQGRGETIAWAVRRGF